MVIRHTVHFELEQRPLRTSFVLPDNVDMAVAIRDGRLLLRDELRLRGVEDRDVAEVTEEVDQVFARRRQ